MKIGDTVRMVSTGEIGVIINTGEGWSPQDGSYILYTVKVGTGRYMRIYSLRAEMIAAV